ncbi:MAG: DUF2807 domain-containing protein [Microscillaceae bacterium]|nr:DUF2807 domain-containing protein [Microscillaceae bacterium]
MKTLCLFGCFFLLIWFGDPLLAQQKATFSLANFQAIEASGAMQITLVPANEEKVEIEYENIALEQIVCEVRNQTLYLSTKDQHKGRLVLHCRVYFRSLTSLSLRGAISVEGKQAIKSSQLKLKAAGASSMRLKLDVDTFVSSTSGASKIYVSGIAQSQEISLTGASVYEAFELNSSQADVQAAGTSKVQIWVSQRLKADVSGTSQVLYRGQPNQTDFQQSGVGSIKSIH